MTNTQTVDKIAVLLRDKDNSILKQVRKALLLGKKIFLVKR